MQRFYTKSPRQRSKQTSGQTWGCSLNLEPSVVAEFKPERSFKKENQTIIRAKIVVQQDGHFKLRQEHYKSACKAHYDTRLSNSKNKSKKV